MRFLAIFIDLVQHVQFILVTGFENSHFIHLNRRGSVTRGKGQTDEGSAIYQPGTDCVPSELRLRGQQRAPFMIKGRQAKKEKKRGKKALHLYVYNDRLYRYKGKSKKMDGCPATIRLTKGERHRTYSGSKATYRVNEGGFLKKTQSFSIFELISLITELASSAYSVRPQLTTHRAVVKHGNVVTVGACNNSV